MSQVSDSLHFRYTIGRDSLEFFQLSFHTVYVLSVFSLWGWGERIMTDVGGPCFLAQECNCCAGIKRC